MKTLTNIIVTHIVFLALFAGAAYAVAQEDLTICTMDAKVCSDGSAVGRSGPNCTFALCPSEREALQESRSDHIENREELRENMQEHREEMTDSLQERRGELNEDRAEFQAQSEEVKAERQEKMTERKAQLAARSQERITNLASNMADRTDSVIGRLQNIINRFTTRIDKLAESGVDTGAAEAILASAQNSVDLATLEIENIDTDIAYAVGGEDVRAAWSGVKEKFTTVRNLLKSAHGDLRATIVALKSAVSEAEDSGVSRAVRMNSENTETEEIEEDDTSEAAI